MKFDINSVYINSTIKSINLVFNSKYSLHSKEHRLHMSRHSGGDMRSNCLIFVRSAN